MVNGNHPDEQMRLTAILSLAPNLAEPEPGAVGYGMGMEWNFSVFAASCLCGVVCYGMG
jgi:hypothetical protein